LPLDSFTHFLEPKTLQQLPLPSSFPGSFKPFGRLISQLSPLAPTSVGNSTNSAAIAAKNVERAIRIANGRMQSYRDCPRSWLYPETGNSDAIASYWPSRLLARRIGHVVYAPGISHPFEVDQPRDRAAIFVGGKGDYDESPVRGRLQCLGL
jgi:hypothetical protein